MEHEDKDEVRVSFEIIPVDNRDDEVGVEEEFLSSIDNADEEGQEKGEDSDTTTVVYQWDGESIDIANRLSIKKGQFLGCPTPTRESRRTYMDNEVDIAAYLNNEQNWKVLASRMSLFFGCILCYVGLFMVFITSANIAKKYDITAWKYICMKGSVSALYSMSTSGPTTSTNLLFEAFLGTGAILILFSNFGYYIVPRWESHRSLSAREGIVGVVAHQTMKHICICRSSYRRIEATSNWVVGEEGIFKVTYNIVAVAALKLLASVPITQDIHSDQDAHFQFQVHDTLAKIVPFTLVICELYQLFRGERMHKRCTGMIQIMRLLSVIIGLICLGVFNILQAAPYASNGKGLSVVFEWVGFFLMCTVMFLYCFVPIKATQSVFALNGSDLKKKHRVASQIVKND